MKWMGALAALVWWLTMAQPLFAAPADGQTFERRRWSQAEGAPQTAISMAQTDDGLLWFATATGLYTFDGVRFERASTVYGAPLRSDNVAAVLRVPGGLAVGYMFGGLDILQPSGAVRYVAGKDVPPGSIIAMAADSRGTLYAATGIGILRLAGGKFERLGADSIPRQPPMYISVDKDDTLWAAFNYSYQSDYTYYAMPRGAQRFERVFGAPLTGTSQVDGRMMVTLPGERFLELAAGQVPRRIDVAGARAYDDILLGGPGGTLWTSREDGFVRLAPGDDGVLAPAEKFDRPGGMARYTTTSLLDREGNLWVATLEGVERFRRHRLHRLTGGGGGADWLAQPGLADEVWYGPSDGALMRLGPDGSRRPVGVEYANVVLRAGPDHVWVATRDALWEFRGATRRRFYLPEAKKWGVQVHALALDARGRLLASIEGKGLWRFEEEQWTRDERTRGLADFTPFSMLTTSQGRTWLGFAGGRLGELVPDGVRLLPPAAGLDAGSIASLQEVSGRLLIGAERGVYWLDGDRVHALPSLRGGAFRGVAGMAVDAHSGLWLHGTDGLHHVRAESLAQTWATPGHAVDSELFNFEDGLRGQVPPIRPLPALAVAQGRIWYATVSQVGSIDPLALPRNPRAPDVLIRSLHAAGRDYPVTDGIRLPEGTTAVDLAFTATALSIPERVRLRFRLEGVDADWRDVLHERSASYANLAPGSYRFRVIAANEDGVWNTTGAAVSFEIAPAIWQTAWFRALCVLAALALLALLYRWRLAVAARRATERANARIEERERIARSLHDTLLQAVQGLVLRFQAEVMRMPPDSPSAAALDTALADADQLIASTRDEVMALRQVPAADVLLDELRSAIATLAPGSDHLLHFALHGEPRPLRAEAAGEVFCALREAAVNSVRHAQASRIAVELCFLPRMLEACVIDDGIGIDRNVARTGRQGHYGIVGMRERIGHLGGRIAVAPMPDGGTAVRIRIPARAAYEAQARRRWFRRRSG